MYYTYVYSFVNYILHKIITKSQIDSSPLTRPQRTTTIPLTTPKLSNFYVVYVKIVGYTRVLNLVLGVFFTMTEINFEESIKELELIVAKLEGGQLSLEDAIEQYIKGTKLKENCEKRLNEAKLKLEQIEIKTA